MFCNMQDEDIIANPDVNSVYELPIIFGKQKFAEKILRKLYLNLRIKTNGLNQWKGQVKRMKGAKKRDCGGGSRKIF